MNYNSDTKNFCINKNDKTHGNNDKTLIKMRRTLNRKLKLIYKEKNESFRNLRAKLW